MLKVAQSRSQSGLPNSQRFNHNGLMMERQPKSQDGQRVFNDSFSSNSLLATWSQAYRCRGTLDWNAIHQD